MEKFSVLNDNEMKKVTGGGLWSDAGKTVGKVAYGLVKGLALTSEGVHTGRIISKKKK